MKKVADQYGVWISNNLGNLFSLNSGLKETMFKPEITSSIWLKKEVMQVSKTHHHLILLMLFQTAIGNSLI